jgi:hypothetical protein
MCSLMQCRPAYTWPVDCVEMDIAQALDVAINNQQHDALLWELQAQYHNSMLVIYAVSCRHYVQ